mmetsp:Transcript_88680/g.185361  ORF Transcript_88680/g.185361 Transcript_88680/m.185361 type:complete len:498 (-) Transcript_88680:54-1547(-)|eukprot:CAMPEP_0206455946 /NCGR_PEP_ID=MMETSP0324_2-20121206/22076_1 /ASSEMBLY_ACC=CAM_ASM_000836 /TAXON_ID=2866 /ORGANISM="Crypthecodinium cohnii, Strain Seligo" /LENGTH=497 /DNA_ID=CAMNT_0053926789 /DNA_START=86 /DNA_END=1579 /DNA_ORIENTATION=-
MAERATSNEAIKATHAALVKTFQTGKTKSLSWRLEQLQALKRMMAEKTDDMIQAIAADLGRPKMEAVLCEISASTSELDHLIACLPKWVKPERVSTPLLQQPGTSEVHREPKGVALIISPWNFPFNLAMGGLFAALGAGNCVCLKPSEVAPASERLLAEILPQYLDPDAVKVVIGGVEESTELLKLKWDHIMYTGNGQVARIVARAAAENLTPTTLELGGKSPTVILPGANLNVAAKRILSGKSMNAGQICIAPDYLLVHKDVEKAFVAEMTKVVKSFFGPDASKSDSFGRIITERHWSRIKGLLDGADGEVLYQLGSPDEKSKFIPPTLIKAPSKSSKIMQEEIFGPVMPMLTVGTTDEIVDYINSGDKPLALYIFGPPAAARTIIDRTSSGGVCVNDTLLHITNPNLPFGGVGESGMGKYHGKWGFDEFSHIRGVMIRGTWIDVAQRYPPYTEANFKFFSALMSGNIVPPGVKKAMMAAGGAAVAGAALFARSKL